MQQGATDTVRCAGWLPLFMDELWGAADILAIGGLGQCSFPTTQREVDLKLSLARDGGGRGEGWRIEDGDSRMEAAIGRTAWWQCVTATVVEN